ncbi:MAG TPA: PASTA domain-containing protein [Gaiellaceae bacterium]|jgi:PASTA domain-containing protein|nr:PASTA domain-containing protein [Gaiellaceae bacterium]
MLSKQGAARALAVAVVAIAAAFLTGPASALPPANDSFATAVELSGRSDAASGTNKDATKEGGEPNHAGEVGGTSVWFRWTAPVGGETTIQTCGSDFDTLLAAYTGDAVNALTEIASNDDACVFGSSISFTAEEGETYRIAIDGNDGETGLFDLQLRLAPPNDDFADAVVISGDEGSVDGTNDGASLEASDPGDVSNSVWYRWTAPSTGPAAFKTCGSPFDTAIAVYTGSALGSLTFVTYSDDACAVGSIARFEASAGTTYNVAVGGCCGEVGDFTLAWDRSPPLPFAIDYPSISGIAREGNTLTGSPGQWTGSPTFTYAWGRCDAPVDECDVIPGATGQTYTVTTRDIGNRLFLQVTGTNVSGSYTEYSDLTLIVRPGGPTNTSPPEVIGRAAVGEYIDATTGNWTGAQPITYAYQWQLCNSAGADCRDLAGERAATVRVEEAHVGGTLRAVVIASNPDGARASVSSPTGVVVRAQVTQVRRCVVPKLRGKTLRAARTAIRRGNCRVGRVQRRFSSRMKAGRVISQRPRAGARLAANARVHVIVSKGKRR